MKGAPADVKAKGKGNKMEIEKKPAQTKSDKKPLKKDSESEESDS